MTYYQRNREVILNRAKDCYENKTERLTELAEDKDKEDKEAKKSKYYNK